MIAAAVYIKDKLQDEAILTQAFSCLPVVSIYGLSRYLLLDINCTSPAVCDRLNPPSKLTDEEQRFMFLHLKDFIY